MNTDVLKQLWGGRWSVTLPAVGGIFAVVYGVLLMVSPQEGTSYSFGNFMALVAPLALAAAGTTVVLLTGGFDLSVAGVISLTNVVCATQMSGASSPWLIVALVLGIGMVSGAVNGLLVVFFGLQSLAVSLASTSCSPVWRWSCCPHRAAPSRPTSRLSSRRAWVAPSRWRSSSSSWWRSDG